MAASDDHEGLPSFAYLPVYPPHAESDESPNPEGTVISRRPKEPRIVSAALWVLAILMVVLVFLFVPNSPAGFVVIYALVIWLLDG
jgi:hypothetical protein